MRETTAEELTQAISRHVRLQDLHLIAVGSDVEQWIDDTFEENQATHVHDPDNTLDNGTGVSASPHAIPFSPRVVRIIPLLEFFR